jgi:hypothetical protein
MNRAMSQKSGTAKPTGAYRFTEKQGLYLAFIYVYSRMFRRARPKPTCNDTSSSPRLRSTTWSLTSNGRD